MLITVKTLLLKKIVDLLYKSEKNSFFKLIITVNAFIYKNKN